MPLRPTSSEPRRLLPGFAGITAASNLVLLGVVVLGSWLALGRIEQQVRRDAGVALDTLLETTHGALVVWANNRLGNADELAQEPAIVAASAALLRAPREPDVLLASPQQAELRTIFARKAAHHEHEGFLVIAPDGTTLASKHDGNVGRPSVLLEQRPELWARALRGESVLVPPLRSQIPLAELHGQLRADAPTMFVTAPVRGAAGEVVAVLALRLDPHRDFSRLTELARIGETGETYAFDEQGRSLTVLRFADELRAAGLLDQDRSAILSTRLGDPGGDVRQGHAVASPSTLPLTHAVASATAGTRDHDLQGYRDYRGVRVLGTWRWSDELGMGLASEIDEDVALRPYHSTRRSVAVLVGLTALLSIVITWLVFWSRARNLRALAEREARLRSILDTAIDGIVTIDAQGRIETLNAAAEAMFGYPAAAVVGQPLAMLVPSASGRALPELVARHLGTGEARQAAIDREEEGRREDGTTFPLEIGLAEVETAGGAGKPRYTGVLRDITERKSLEARFLQSQKLQAVGQLAAGVAHDFNNLLMGVSGSARVALNRIDDRERVRSLLEEIRGASATGAAITRQLLTMTRMKGGRPVEVELDAAVGGSRAMLERLLGEDVRLEMTLDAPGAWLRCGDGHVEQLLINLVVNARDAMPKGGTLAIRTRARQVGEPGAHGELAPGPYVVLEVEDTGIGMDEEVRKRIFEPFFTTKEVGKGTGLGLSTVYGIVTQAGGTIEVDSTLGEGTTFRLLLPRLEDPARDRTAPTKSRPSLPPMTVLVVEDEALVRDTIRHYLRTAGHRVLVASGRREAEALVAAHQGPIEALVTDVVLRRESGADVAADVRARDPEVAVVFMSAHPAEYLWKTGRLEPGTPVLQKPFEQEELHEWLRTAIEASRTAAAGTAAAGRTEAEAEAEREPLAVLLVEDQDASRNAITELLQDEGFRVLAARTGAEAEQLYEAEQGRVVVVTDFGLPDVSGDALVERLAAKHPLRGVVFVSGRDEDDPQVLAVLGHPHTSFLSKPVDIDTLVERIRGAS